MIGGNYINPCVLGFPTMISDSGYYGITFQVNNSDIPNHPHLPIPNPLQTPWAMIDFTDGTYGAATGVGFFIINMTGAFFEFNSTGLFLNGIQVISAGGEVDTISLTYTSFLANSNYLMGDDVGNWTCATLSGFADNVAVPQPAVAVGAGITGTVTFSDPNPTNLSFRVKLVLTGTATSGHTLFSVVYTLSSAFTPKVIFSPSGGLSATVRCYVDADSITTTGFNFLNFDGLGAGTYTWDFIVCS